MLSRVEAKRATAVVQRAAGPEVDVAASVVEVPAVAAAGRPYASGAQVIDFGNKHFVGAQGRFEGGELMGTGVTDCRGDVVHLRFDHVDHRVMTTGDIGTVVKIAVRA